MPWPETVACASVHEWPPDGLPRRLSRRPTCSASWKRQQAIDGEARGREVLDNERARVRAAPDVAPADPHESSPLTKRASRTPGGRNKC
jgi:hypothetical protein